MTPKLASFGDSSYICIVIQRNYEVNTIYFNFHIFMLSQPAEKPAEFLKESQTKQ